MCHSVVLVLQHVAVCCSVLQCVAVCYNVLQCVISWCTCCSMLRCVAVQCVLYCVAVWMCSSVLHMGLYNPKQFITRLVFFCLIQLIRQKWCVTVCCSMTYCNIHNDILSMLLRVAVCCRGWQCDVVRCTPRHQQLLAGLACLIRQ